MMHYLADCLIQQTISVGEIRCCRMNTAAVVVCRLCCPLRVVSIYSTQYLPGVNKNVLAPQTEAKRIRSRHVPVSG